MKNVTKTVKEILANNPKTRNSDYWLWLEVIKADMNSKGTIALLRMWTIEDFLTYGFNMVPHFETVSRARRLIQSQCPELRGEECVQDARSELEQEYREYALNERG